MSKRIIAGLVVLIVIAGFITWLVNRKDNTPAAPLLSVSALNQTKNVPANNTNANPGDVIVYTLTAENQADKTISGYIIEANIGGIANQAQIVDASGGSYNAATNSLVWTPLDIAAHESISKTFTVKVSPLTAGTANAMLKITFNNELNISVTGATVSGAVTPGQPQYHAPATGPAESLPLILAVITTVGIIGIKLYKRTKIVLWG